MLADGDCALGKGAGSHDPDRRGLPDPLAAQRAHQLAVEAVHLLARDRDDPSRPAPARLPRPGSPARRRRAGARSLPPKLLGQVGRQPDGLCPDAEVAAAHAAVRLQALDHLPDGRPGDGHAGAAEESRAVEPDHLTGGADQRPAREAGVHDDIGLQIAVHLAAGRRAPKGLPRCSMMPNVAITVCPGRPSASTTLPTRRASGKPIRLPRPAPAAGAPLNCRRARSVVGSRPTSLAEAVWPSGRPTPIFSILLHDVVCGQDDPDPGRPHDSSGRQPLVSLDVHLVLLSSAATVSARALEKSARTPGMSTSTLYVNQFQARVSRSFASAIFRHLGRQRPDKRYYRRMRPRRVARTTASVRLSTPSLPRMALTWNLTGRAR